MRLIRIVIISDVDNKTIRNVEFNINGPSFIIDDGDKSLSGNNIGKTTFVKIVNLCLGAKTVETLYKGNGTNPNDEIRTFLNEERIYAALTIKCEDGTIHILRRDLFDKGFCYFDGNKMNQSDYLTNLKNFFMPDCKDDELKFRFVIPFFVRVSDSAEKMFNFNSNYFKNSDYREVYRFLFGTLDDNKDLKIENNIEMFIDENHRILKKYKIKSIDELSNLIDEDTKSILKINAEMKSKEVLKDFEKDNDNIILLERENELSIEKYELEIKKSVWESRINSEEKKIQKIDIQSLKLLYDDGEKYIKKLDLTFEDLVTFHDSMVHKRINRYKERLEDCNNRIDEINLSLSDVRKKITENMVEYKFGLNSNLNAQYDTILDLREEKKNKEKHYRIFNENLAKINELKGKQLQIEKNEDYEMNVRAEINKEFVEFEKQILHEKNELCFSDEKFPITLCGGGKGSGDSKAVIACLAFALFVRYDKLKREMPRFLILDMMENVDLKTLKPLIEESRKMGYQVIIPILNDRLSQIGVMDSERILTLSKSDKLFRI